jgi:hypothetical protein
LVRERERVVGARITHISLEISDRWRRSQSYPSFL